MKLFISTLILIILPFSSFAQELVTSAAITFTEGPTVDRDGNVYFSEVVSKRIMKFDTTGALSVFRENSNVANGMVFDFDNRLIICEGQRFFRSGVDVAGIPRVTRTNLATGKIEILADNFEGKPLTGPNDVTIDGRGRIYFTDRDGQAVYRIDAPGVIERILDSETVQKPNGIQISPDEKTLYIVETNKAEGGARMIRAFDLSPEGKASNMRVHHDFYPGRSGDGMSIDIEGNLYVAAGLNRLRGTPETLDTKAGVHVISPEGKLIKFIPVHEDTITNTTFGGSDMKTLYVTAGKTLFSIKTDIAGLSR